MVGDGAQAVNVGNVVAGRQRLVLGHRSTDGHGTRGRVIDIGHRRRGRTGDRLRRTLAIGVGSSNRDGGPHVGLRKNVGRAGAARVHPTAQPVVGDGAQSVFVGNAVAGCQRLVLRGRAADRDRSCRRVIGIGDGDADDLCGSQATVAGHDRHVIDVVGAAVGRRLVVGRCHEGQHARGTVDGETRRIGSAATANWNDAVGDRLSLAIGGSDGRAGGAVLASAGGSAAGDHRRGVHRVALKKNAISVTRALATPQNHDLQASPGHTGGDLRQGCRRVDQGFAGERRACAAELAQVNTIAAAVLRIALPGRHEVAVGVEINAWISLVGRRCAVELDLAAQGRAGTVVAACKGTVKRAVRPGPGNDKIAGPVHRYTAQYLIARSRGVDQELAALRHTAGVVALRIDPFATTILSGAAPGDDKVAAGIHANVRQRLVARRGAIDAKLTALRHTARVVALRIDARAAAVLGRTGPGDDEARGAHPDGRAVLRTRRGGVHLELAALRHAAGVVALCIDAVAGTILQLAAPGNHKVAVVIHGDRDLVLVAGARHVRVDLELASGGRAIGVVDTCVDVVGDGVFPDRHKIAAAIGGDLRTRQDGGLLVVGGGGVDQCLATDGRRRQHAMPFMLCRCGQRNLCLDLTALVLQKPIAALRLLTSPVSAGGHIGASQQGHVVDQRPARDRTGQVAAIKHEIRIR